MSIYSIYKATNLITGKIYIGFDSSWPNRKKHHLHKYRTINTRFYHSIRKHGWENFEWEIIYQSKDYEHCLNVMEPHFIKEHNTFNSGYNMTLGGDGGMLGKKHSTDSKKKMSLSHLGKKPSKDSLEKQRTKLNEFYENNGSRIKKNCPICNKLFTTLKFQNRITCGRSCASSYRNYNR